MSEELQLVVSTFPDVEGARKVARLMLERRLAACANILPGVESVYWWEEKIENAREVVVEFKTVMVGELCEALRAEHPYEVPFIASWSANWCLPEYLDWVRMNVRQ